MGTTITADHEKTTDDSGGANGANRDAGPPAADSPVNEPSDNHPRRRDPLPFSERAVRVTWAWFPSTMSTGAMVSLISQQPFAFPGLETIGKIYFIVDLVMFVSFTVLIGIRFMYKPRAFISSLHHPSESFFFGSWWVSLALVIYGAQVYGVPAAGPWLVRAMQVLFWMYLGSVMVVVVFQYHVIFEVENLSLSDAVPAWILPAYPLLVTGVLAAAISKEQPQESAIHMIIAGIMGQGLGWILALFIYVVYLSRLINHNMPPPSLRPGMYVSVGPAGYTCAGIVSLGTQAQSVLPDDFLGITSIPVGDLWLGIAVPAALFLWLTAIWFSAQSTVSVLRVARRMTFSLQWWAFVFPNAGLAIATIQIGTALGSTGIKAVGSGITVLLVVMWLFCAFSHIRALVNRDMLAVGKDLNVEEVNRMHDDKKEAARVLDSNENNV